MILAIDVYYKADLVKAVGVIFNRTDDVPAHVIAARRFFGQFYRNIGIAFPIIIRCQEHGDDITFGRFAK